MVPGGAMSFRAGFFVSSLKTRGLYGALKYPDQRPPPEQPRHEHWRDACGAISITLPAYGTLSRPISGQRATTGRREPAGETAKRQPRGRDKRERASQSGASGILPLGKRQDRLPRAALQGREVAGAAPESIDQRVGVRRYARQRFGVGSGHGHCISTFALRFICQKVTELWRPAAL